MNLERLRAVQAEEREADSLRPLADSFYREVADYLTELRNRRAAAAESTDDPFGDEDVRRLTDEIETAEEVAEAIYERRIGKLVKRASLAAAGMPADEEGLTAEEAELFADLVDQIEAHRADVLAAFDADRSGDEFDRSAGVGTDDGSVDAVEAVDGDGATASEPTDEESADAPPPPPDRPAAGEGSATAEDADSDDGSGPSPASGDPGDDVDENGQDATDGDPVDERVTVRITQDVGEVFGVDERVYQLSSEDVVTLPNANAKPLLDRDAAEKIN